MDWQFLLNVVVKPRIREILDSPRLKRVLAREELRNAQNYAEVL